MVRVRVKWGKQVFEDVDVDLTEDVATFKAQLFALTGVPVERQKLMARGVWKGILKDSQDLSGLTVAEGQLVTLMGQADVVKGPEKETVFVEDMSKEEAAEHGTVLPSGLVNLQNTCYLNSTLQCLRHVPELRDAFRVNEDGSGGPNSAAAAMMMMGAAGGAGGAGGPDGALAGALSRTFQQLDGTAAPVPPQEFVMTLRSQFPQFAEAGPRGFKQQDAEEFYSSIMASLARALPRSPLDTSSSRNAIDDLFGLELEERLECEENTEEPPVIREELTRKLVCNIQGGIVSDVQINHLHEGLRLGMEGAIEKHSDLLDRTALWRKTQQIKRLPPYICVQFMRFYWKATPESRDHAGVKCKILKPVTFPMEMDMFEFCTPGLQATLRVHREAARREEDERFAKRHRRDGDGDGAATEEADAKPSASSSASSSSTANETAAAESAMELESAAAPPAPPAATEEGGNGDDEDAMLAQALQMSVEGAAVAGGAVSGGDAAASAAGAAAAASSSAPVELGPGMPANFEGQYELFGVVTHKGRSADGGHYIGWVKREHDQWVEFDDHKVSESDPDTIMNLKGGGDFHIAYLAFYKAKA